MFLPPVSRKEWREPSQRSGLFDIENRTWFRIEARTNDGALFWRGWFEDRDEFDLFLWSLFRGSLRYDRALCNAPVPGHGPHVRWYNFFEPAVHEGRWCPSWADLPLSYHFTTTTFVTSSPGSNQSLTPPSDWVDSGSKIEVIGGGASGGASRGTTSIHATGGGGGAYCSLSNFTWSGSITARVASGGNSVSLSATSTSSGNDGGQGWWNDTAFPTTGTNKVGADKGVHGVAAVGSQNGGAGGAIANNYPASTGFAGGRGGNMTGASGSGASGGGGAGGKVGAGTAGTDSTSTSTNVTTAGGNGDNGSGSTGTAGSATTSSQPTPVTEWTASGGATACAGGGSGGAARATNNATAASGQGGAYGGASGGANNTNSTGTTATSGAGNQGILIYAYQPFPFFVRMAFT